MFLQRYGEEGDEFLDRIVTGDETWIQFLNAETKEQSKQWMHTHSPNEPKKFKQTLSNRKNDGYSILGPQGNFVDRIHDTRDHNNVRGLL